MAFRKIGAVEMAAALITDDNVLHATPEASQSAQLHPPEFQPALGHTKHELCKFGGKKKPMGPDRSLWGRFAIFPHFLACRVFAEL